MLEKAKHALNLISGLEYFFVTDRRIAVSTRQDNRVYDPVFPIIFDVIAVIFFVSNQSLNHFRQHNSRFLRFAVHRFTGPEPELEQLSKGITDEVNFTGKAYPRTINGL